MELVATRPDEWNLYKAGEQYFESRIRLDADQLANDGEEILMNSGNLKQLAFNRDAIKGWFNGSETDQDFKMVLNALEPIFIEFWKEKKLESWIMEIY
jgi:hypothetical protein